MQGADHERRESFTLGVSKTPLFHAVFWVKLLLEKQSNKKEKCKSFVLDVVKVKRN